jgi:ribosomal protein L16 Arg81 hydroxylase
MVLSTKAADEIKITFFFKPFRACKINERAVTGNKLKNNFTEPVTSGLRRMWPTDRQLDNTELDENQFMSRYWDKESPLYKAGVSTFINQ